jgi:phage terminase Nu1 subunit (DNA packaging protein)
MLWTIAKAAPEFGISRETLARRLREMGLEIPKGRRLRKPWLTTKQIMEAVVGSLEKEKTRATAAIADTRELANRVARGELIPGERMREIVRDCFGPIREALLGAPTQLAQKCNPADPPHAYAVITDWVDGVLRIGRETATPPSRDGDPSEDSGPEPITITRVVRD